LHKVHNSQALEAALVPINRWVAKEVVVYLYTIFIHKKE
jgi:hypothetical protein